MNNEFVQIMKNVIFLISKEWEKFTLLSELEVSDRNSLENFLGDMFQGKTIQRTSGLVNVSESLALSKVTESLLYHIVWKKKDKNKGKILWLLRQNQCPQL